MFCGVILVLVRLSWTHSKRTTTALKRWMRRTQFGRVNNVNALWNEKKYDIRNDQRKRVWIRPQQQQEQDEKTVKDIKLFYLNSDFIGVNFYSTSSLPLFFSFVSYVGSCGNFGSPNDYFIWHVRLKQTKEWRCCMIRWVQDIVDNVNVNHF